MNKKLDQKEQTQMGTWMIAMMWIVLLGMMDNEINRESELDSLEQHEIILISQPSNGFIKVMDRRNAE